MRNGRTGRRRMTPSSPSPSGASRRVWRPEYQKAGINLYVALWDGPTEAHLAELKKYGMQVICDQNAVGLAHKDDPIIVGWLQPDEPDDAQALPGGNGYGPPILPARIVEKYESCRKADPTRPVFLGFSMAVAWDGLYGRGVRTRPPRGLPRVPQGMRHRLIRYLSRSGRASGTTRASWISSAGASNGWSNGPTDAGRSGMPSNARGSTPASSPRPNKSKRKSGSLWCMGAVESSISAMNSSPRPTTTRSWTIPRCSQR